MEKNHKTSIEEKLVTARRRRRNWKKVVAVLSCFVAVGTVSLLTLPAITMSRPNCGLEEHQHGEACNGEVSVLACSAESLNIHTHREDCLDAEGNVICRYGDLVIHTHDSACYDAQGSLICSLPEIKEHRHDDSCYQLGEETVVDEGHTHSDGCYSWTVSETPTCALEESQGHTHGDECNDENGERICIQEESSGHQHGPECYGQVQGPLICQEDQREPIVQPGEPVLTCGEEERLLHTHGGECFTTDDETQEQTLTCPLTEIQAHQHTEECFAMEKTLICGKTEHIHDDSCKVEAALTEEEQFRVDDVIAIIESLPSAAEIESEFDRLADDAETLAAYRAKIIGAVQMAFDEYNALTDAQKTAVTNAEKLKEYAYLLVEVPAEPEYMSQIGSITASAELMEGDLPADVKFQINLLPADSAEYADAVRKANVCMELQNLEILDCILLDIGFAGPEGTEAILEGKAKVTLSFAEPILPGLAEVMALHITADGAENVLEDAVWDENGITSLTLITDGFSPFLISRTGEASGILDRLSGDNAFIYDAQMKLDGTRQAIATGTADWDSNDEPGNDSSAENMILRTFDVATYTVSFKTGLRQTATDGGIAGYRTGTVYFEFILNESAERAQFEPGSMGWLTTYEEAKYETVVEENRQILRGSFLMTPAADNESTIGNSYSELTVAVRALRMSQGDTLQPTFALWLEDNDVNAGVVDGIPTKVVTGTDHPCPNHDMQEFRTITPDAITISAAYRLNVALWEAENDKTSYMDWFDFSTGNDMALDQEAVNVRGRLKCYGLVLELRGKNASSGLKGVMLPEPNSTITFDLDMTSWYQPADTNKQNAIKGKWYTLDGTDTQYEIPETLAYAPRVWSASPNLQGVDAQDGREIKTPHNSAVNAAPINEKVGDDNEHECVKDGGTWTFTRDPNNPRITHVTVENFDIDLSSLSNFPAQCSNAQGKDKAYFYDPANESLRNAWDIDRACFAGGEFWVVQPLEATTDQGLKTIESYFGNGELEFEIKNTNLKLGNTAVAQCDTADDRKYDGCALVNPGS